jgi:hypothetical protein
MNKVVKDNDGRLHFKGRVNATEAPKLTPGSLLLNMISKKLKSDVYKFLSVDTMQQFKNIKNEIEGLKQEKEDT